MDTMIVRWLRESQDRLRQRDQTRPGLQSRKVKGGSRLKSLKVPRAMLSTRSGTGACLKLEKGTFRTKFSTKRDISSTLPEQAPADGSESFPRTGKR